MYSIKSSFAGNYCEKLEILPCSCEWAEGFLQEHDIDAKIKGALANKSNWIAAWKNKERNHIFRSSNKGYIKFHRK